MTDLGFVFDTFAWVEVLDAGPRGEEVLALHLANDIGTPAVVLSELAWLAARRAPEKLDIVVEQVCSTSTILGLEPEVAVAAGRTRAALSATRKGIGLLDCIVLETARSLGVPMVTGDDHLRGLDGVRFVDRR